MKKRTELELFKNLKEKRKDIDLIDQKLLSLINQRLCITLEIREIKEEMGEKIYDPEREKEVLGKLKLKNKGPLEAKELKKIFGTIMEICLKSQN